MTCRLHYGLHLSSPAPTLCSTPTPAEAETVLPTPTLVPVSSPTPRHPDTVSWILHSTTSLDSPPDLLTLSQPPLAPASASAPGFQQFPLTCTPSSPCVSINILVTSSQSPRLSLLLGSPVPLHGTVRSGQRDEPSRLCYSPPNPLLPAPTLVPVSSPTPRHPATLSWIPHSTTSLDSPPDLLTLSQPPSLQPQPPHLVSSSFP
ncbi:unnamed protein product [Coregonus sp. 'balchen']|nr:unnamed protein product [Coregonus sp. 'balchen']